MSLNKLCQCLLTRNLQTNKLRALTETVRQFHTSDQYSKNRLWPTPSNLRIGPYRLPRDFDPSKYTIEPIETAKTGGRGPDGRIWIWKIGGGLKRVAHMVDMHRVGPKEGNPLVEKVYQVKKDDWRTGHIALVASGNKKRWIIASNNMKPGDLIKTSGKVTNMPVRAQEGDAHPIGSLPLGTLVHCIEKYAGDGAAVARAAGTHGIFVRKVGDKCVVRMPSKRELVLAPECMVTVGQVSNITWNKDKKMSGPLEARWRGKRPKSGWKMRKTGYHGRKIKGTKAPLVCVKQPEAKPLAIGFSFK